MTAFALFGNSAIAFDSNAILLTERQMLFSTHDGFPVRAGNIIEDGAVTVWMPKAHLDPQLAGVTQGIPSTALPKTSADAGARRTSASIFRSRSGSRVCAAMRRRSAGRIFQTSALVIGLPHWRLGKRC
jgi:hypothetical protein